MTYEPSIILSWITRYDVVEDLIYLTIFSTMERNLNKRLLNTISVYLVLEQVIVWTFVTTIRWVDTNQKRYEYLCILNDSTLYLLLVIVLFSVVLFNTWSIRHMFHCYWVLFHKQGIWFYRDWSVPISRVLSCDSETFSSNLFMGRVIPLYHGVLVIPWYINVL